MDEDQFFCRQFDYNNDLIDHFQNSAILDQYNLPKVRTSQDKIINNEGNMLIDTSKLNNLFILNGRYGTDKNVGAMTFRNQSIIDYSIISHQALKFVHMLNILELDSLFSDGHSLITTTLNFSQKLAPCKSKKTRNSKRKPKLPEDKKILFIQNLNYLKIAQLHDNIVNAINNLSSVNSDKVNDICHQFSDIFSGSAQSFSHDSSNSNYKKGKKVWFGKQCENARKQYHFAKRKHSKYSSTSTKMNLISASKKYKRKLKYFINKHNK